ncbi:MAG TPA: IS5 family transposase [Candidatus Methylomirabilis sp.]|nr:IS5 family transposase [Candidatus Methylomirabilis sp.]
MPARQAAPKPAYRIRNWNEYNDSLVRRGSLTLWIEEATLQAWRYQGPAQQGAQFVSSDLAIEGLLTLRAVYHLTLRATEGFAHSLFDLMGLERTVPDSSTLCRRAATVRVTLPKRAEGPLHLVLDCTGRKVYGEGEWKVRQHGYSKRRTWLKLHLAVDPQSHEIQAAIVSEPGVTDAEATPSLLEQVENPVEVMTADGMYDRQAVDTAAEHRGARAVLPPRRDAKILRHGNSSGPRLDRDENLRRIRQIGRKAWKEESGYHERSLGETAMFRLKTIFGGEVAGRRPPQQATEVGIRCRAMNIMTHQGMPQSERVAA